MQWYLSCEFLLTRWSLCGIQTTCYKTAQCTCTCPIAAPAPKRLICLSLSLPLSSDKSLSLYAGHFGLRVHPSRAHDGRALGRLSCSGTADWYQNIRQRIHRILAAHQYRGQAPCRGPLFSTLNSRCTGAHVCAAHA